MPPYTLRMYPPAPSPCGGGGGGWPAYLDVHATLQCRTFHHGGASPTLRPVSKSLPTRAKPVGAIRTKSVTARTIVPQARARCRDKIPRACRLRRQPYMCPPSPCGGGDGGGVRLHTSMSMQHFNAEPFMMVGQAPPYDRSANRKTAVGCVPQARTQCRYQNPACVSAAPPHILQNHIPPPRRAKPVGAVRTKSVTARTMAIAHNTMISRVGWVSEERA